MATVLDGVHENFGNGSVQKRRQRASLSNSCLKSEAMRGGGALFNIAVRVGVERAQQVNGVGRKADVLQCGKEELLGDGREGGGEVKEDASAVRLCEGGNHGGGVDLKEVGEYGSSAEESLLAW